MADPRQPSSLISAQSALEGLGIVDLNDPGPSSHAAGNGYRPVDYSSGSGTASNNNNNTTGSRAMSQSHLPAARIDLLLPDSTGAIRVPEGQRYAVRAVYDFEATDESALSFNAGDIIEVLTMLTSGWWDGMLGEARGWFPSNYVENIDDLDDDYDGADEPYEPYDDVVDDYDDQYDVEIAPDGRAIARNGSAADVLGLEESLGHGWDSWGGDTSGTSLDNLAFELMEGRGDGRQHSARGQLRADRASKRHTATAADYEEIDDPDLTLRPAHHSRGGQPQTQISGAHYSHANGNDGWVPRATAQGNIFYVNIHTGEEQWGLPGDGDEDADGFTRLAEMDHLSEHGVEQRSLDANRYYGGGQGQSRNYQHNRSASSFDRSYYQPPQPHHIQERARRPASTSSTVSRASRPPSSSMPADDVFGIHPSRTGVSVPYPWTVGLTDDGRSYYYYNQQTGETRRDPPPSSTTVDGVLQDPPPRRASVGATMRSDTVRSITTRRRAQTDWEERIRTAVAPLYDEPERATMGQLTEQVIDAINELYDAAVAGSAAEEEVALARDIQSGSGMAVAVLNDDAAVRKLKDGQARLTTAIRHLMSAFGYVGPVLPPPGGIDSTVSEPMPRPPWVDSLNLMGVMGLLSMSITNTISGPRASDVGTSSWNAVMRAVTKLRDLIDDLPNVVLAHVPAAERQNQPAKHLVAWFGAESLGDFMSGRFGFGPALDTVLRPLDQAAVVEIQKLKAEVDAVVRAAATSADGGVLEVIRVSARFRDAIAHIDVAVAIDLDGDASEENGSETLREEDTRLYADLVVQARHGIRDLDDAATALDATSADIYLRSDTVGSSASLEALTKAVTTVFRSLSALLVVSQQQTAAIEQGVVRGAMGQRSPGGAVRRAAAAAAHARTYSVASFESHRSHRSHDLQRLRDPAETHTRNQSMASSESSATQQTGPEQEVLEREEIQQRHRSIESTHQPSSRRHSQSTIASQTSLPKKAGDASSSQTSLPYQQESEAGSVRGNRASILKAVPSFLRNRSSSDAPEEPRTSRNRSGSKKLAKLLGDDTFSRTQAASVQAVPSTPVSPASHPPPPPMAMMGKSAPWYLATAYPPGEIVEDDNGILKAGTIQVLVERLTAHTAADTNFFKAFMLTYRSFVTTDELIDLLIERFDITPPPGLSEDELVQWTVRKQTPIRLRVVNTLKTWLDQHFVEGQDEELLVKVEAFAQARTVGAKEMLVRQLDTLIGRSRKRLDLNNARQGKGMAAPPAPIQIRQQPGKPVSFLDYSPLEIARQLTIMESGYYQRIKPIECMHKAWQAENSAELAPNLMHTISATNRLSRWTSLVILRTRNVKERALVLRHCISIATELRGLNNFAGMAGVFSGLSGSGISRLKKTWELVPEKSMREFHAIEVTMDRTKNFSKYKEMLKTINPPCVPFFGFYLSALVFIEEGNKDFVVAQPPGSSSAAMTPSASTSSIPRAPSMTGTTRSAATTATSATNGPRPSNESGGPLLINFFKRQLTAEVLRDIQQYQSQPYNLAVFQPVLDYIEEGMDDADREEQDLYDISCVIEPKEQTDAHARALQSSVSTTRTGTGTQAMAEIYRIDRMKFY
ncbi:cell division cycle-related protein [Vanrija albida]|uniref:Cell division cycle-related protein n=1 Tax=Vanrija albida TaxID=181172 RepID=A0ABR3PXZ8_9TREE